jgi:beta-lactamase class A
MKTPQQSSPGKRAWWRYATVLWAFAILGGAACFGVGWYLSGSRYTNLSIPQPLRLDSSQYTFINPLLSCNLSALNIFQQDQAMNAVITTAINANVALGNINQGSAYFTDFNTGKFSNVNGSLEYYPSSITKIPIMMAYYELAESSSSILDQEITYPLGAPDLNDSQETKPAVPIIPGQTYTVEELIEHMIKYSDNNAAGLLFADGDQDAITNVYNDLQIPIVQDVTATNLNFITPQQISTLFKVLYNSTYLSRDYSEKALELLSQSDFTEGLVSGVPSSTIVAHKFGIVGIDTNGIETGRELHDCGIIYAPSHPYLLCVMTRGSSTLPMMEGAIANISESVYNQVETNGD